MEESAAETLYYYFELTFLDRGCEGANPEVKEVILGSNFSQLLSSIDVFWCFNPESTIFAQINQQFRWVNYDKQDRRINLYPLRLRR